MVLEADEPGEQAPRPPFDLQPTLMTWDEAGDLTVRPCYEVTDSQSQHKLDVSFLHRIMRTHA